MSIRLLFRATRDELSRSQLVIIFSITIAVVALIFSITYGSQSLYELWDTCGAIEFKPDVSRFVCFAIFLIALGFSFFASVPIINNLTIRKNKEFMFHNSPDMVEGQWFDAIPYLAFPLMVAGAGILYYLVYDAIPEPWNNWFLFGTVGPFFVAAFIWAFMDFFE